MKIEEIKPEEIISAFPAVDAVTMNGIIKQVVNLATNLEDTPLQRFHTIVILTDKILDVFGATRDEAANYLIKGKHVPSDISVNTRIQSDSIFERHKDTALLEVDGCKFSWIQIADWEKLARKNDKLAAKIKIRNQKEKDLMLLNIEVARDIDKLRNQKEFAKTKPSSVHNMILFDDIDFS